MNVTLDLPLPPIYAAPNKRPVSKRGRIALSAEVKKNRRDCSLIACTHRKHFRDAAEVEFSMTYYHQDRRYFCDDDNLVARAKSTRDGIADGLAIDDKHFNMGFIEQRVDKARPRLICHIEVKKWKT